MHFPIRRIGTAAATLAAAAAIFAIPASASAQALDSSGERCRVVQANFNPEWYDWYCDASGNVTYTEIVWARNPATPMSLSGYVYSGDLRYPTGNGIHAIAYSEHIDQNHSIVWTMVDSNQAYQWDAVGPTTWVSTAMTRLS